MLTQINDSSLRMVVHRAGVALEFALQSIWSVRRRMWLVVLGAAIGFGSIDSMLIIGSSMQARIQSSLDSLGGDMLTLTISVQAPYEENLPQGGRPLPHRPVRPAAVNAEALDAASFSQLVKGMPQVESAAWVLRRQACMNEIDDVQNLEILQMPLEAQNLLSLKLLAGRALHPGDLDQPNLLIGSAALEAMRAQKPYIGVGSQIRYCGQVYRIVGSLLSHPGSDFVQPVQINDSAFVAGKAIDADAMKTLLVRLRPGTPAEAFGKQLSERAHNLLPGYAIQTTGAWEFIKQRQQQASLYARFLAVLGSVSLLVGIMGIANMMLVTVSERRAEIGLRMAIGAKRADIVAQFLFEGVLICLVGSALGLLLGWSVAKFALNLGGFDTELSASVVVQASLLAVCCGIVSGAYPAHRAASIDPVVSLQG